MEERFEVYREMAERFFHFIKNEHIYLSDENDYDEWEFDGFSVASGCSKTVLIPDDSELEYVIKIPNDIDSYRYYLDKEVEMTENLPESLEPLFYKTYYLFSFKWEGEHNYYYWPVYIQERAEGSCFYYPSKKQNDTYYQIAADIADEVMSSPNTPCSEEYGCGEDALGNTGDTFYIAAYLSCSEEVYRRLIAFLYEYNVNDLHRGNFCCDTKPVFDDEGHIIEEVPTRVKIFDYSGYYE